MPISGQMSCWNECNGYALCLSNHVCAFNVATDQLIFIFDHSQQLLNEKEIRSNVVDLKWRNWSLPHISIVYFFSIHENGQKIRFSSNENKKGSYQSTASKLGTFNILNVWNHLLSMWCLLMGKLLPE